MWLVALLRDNTEESSSADLKPGLWSQAAQIEILVLPPKNRAPGGSVVKNLPANAGDQDTQETQVQSPGREDPLEEERATHSSSLAWKTPWIEEPDELQSMGSQESDTAEHTPASL